MPSPLSTKLTAIISFVKLYLILFVVGVLTSFSASAQYNRGSTSRWLDSLKTYVDSLYLTPENLAQDSLLLEQIRTWKETNSFRDFVNSPKIPSIKPSEKKTGVQITGGYVSYLWNYRSTIDTPFQEAGVSQHFVQGRAQLILAQSLPISISYLERQSNSRYFRDYRDIRIDFNLQEFRRLQVQKLTQSAENLINKVVDPTIPEALNQINRKLEKMDQIFNQKEWTNRLIHSRLVLLQGGNIDSNSHQLDTSSVQDAKKFIAFYDQLQNRQARIRSFRDSLHHSYQQVQKSIMALRKLMAGQLPVEDREVAISNFRDHYNLHDKKPPAFSRFMQSIRTISLGKMVPAYSDLTLRNINVNGINFEYYHRFYFALTAGAIDYRARDFFYTNSAVRKPQFIYLSRLGYGSPESSHVYVTAFKGKKQLLSTGTNPNVLEIYGLSFETQWAFSRNNRLLAELAQSASPALLNRSGPSEKPSFRFNDEQNKAYSIRWDSYFPQTKTRLNAFYKYRGINFQSFSSYYTNADQKSWQIRADQYFFNRIVHLNLSMLRNSFENSLLPVRYTGKATLTSVQVQIKRKKLPSLQIGYMPASQYSQIDGQIYQNYFQTLSLTASHFYKIGLVQALTVFSANRFYNNAPDTGFLYYNARNYFVNQHFQFLSFTADLNVSKTNSQDYDLTVIETGVATRLWKQSGIGFGVKINQLNQQSVRVGFMSNGQIMISKLGELSIGLEKSWLPSSKGSLVNSDFYHVGFTRYFN